jgi:peptide/nickel transport system substrate-binding protein
MNRRLWATLPLAVVLGVMVAACGAAPAGNNATASANASATKGLVTTTAAGTTTVSSATWAVYRDVNTLDPLYAFDYPENTAISLMCESLLRQAPDGSVGPGVATLTTPDPTTLVLTLRPGVKFWDGNPVTAADVVFGLQRTMDPSLGGFYAASLSRVKSVKATASDQVTITLKEPDYWLPGELSGMPGVVVEKSFVEKQGKNYGTPAGAIMGTGAYMLKSWNTGTGVVAVSNPHYWDSSVTPLVQKIVIKGIPATSALTSGLLTGAVQGSYMQDYSTVQQLQQSNATDVYKGPSGATDALVICNLKGTLGDQRVRQALSLALDRQGVINTIYKGAALVPRWLSNPGTFGYAAATFNAAYDQSAVMNQDIAKAKDLVQQAGATGKTITIGMSSEISAIAAEAGAYQAAGQAIGLKVKFKSVSAANFVNFFIDPKARQGVDGFPTVNYGDYADPAALLATVVLSDGSQNFSGFSDSKITSLLDQARGTADPDKRASLVAQAEQATAEQLPWIPTVQPVTVLVLDKKLTGAVASFSYMGAPWANELGGH